MTKPEFRLDVHDLDAAGKTLDSEIRAAWLRGVLEGTDVAPEGDGHLHVRYSKSGNDVVLHGRVKARLQTPCARCLEPARFDIDSEIGLLLVPEASPRAAFAKGKTGGKGATEEHEIGVGEADLDTYDGEEVILDGFVREALLLEVPQFPLCKENCPGMVRPPENTGASEEPEIDPRLAPLLRLKGATKKDAS